MGTISSAFSLMSQALDADQSALNIVANNVANANTAGYTVESPNWQENAPVVINGVSYGAGVSETGPKSTRDTVLTERLDQQQQLASASGTRLSSLNAIQALFTPATGSASSSAGDIGSDVSNFFTSFTSLEANPTDSSLRQQVLSTASILSGDVSYAAQGLNTQRSALDQEAVGVTSQVNSLTSAIAKLNIQIQSTSPNSDGGTLEDQRQQDLSQLSQLVGINQIATDGNGLSVTTTSGQLLVSQGISVPLTTGSSGGVTHFYIGQTDVTSQLATGGGQLGGYLTARDQDVPSALSSLDQLAYSVSTKVNELNNAGTDMAGDTGDSGDIFAQPTQIAGSAASMSVAMTNPNHIAAASAGKGTGDNSNAIAMASLASQAFVGPATANFSTMQNLSATTPVNGTATGNVQVFDSLGQSYNATVTYTNQGANTWSYSISVPDTLTANANAVNQVSYTFGAGETVDPGTNLTITGNTGVGTATITAPAVTPGMAVGTAGPPATGYVAALDAQIAAAGIVGVTVTNTGGVLEITGATSTAGSVIADPVAANATGTLTFNGAGALVTPAGNVGGITFGGLSDGAAPLNLNWNLYAANGSSNITQTAAASTQTGSSQDGSFQDPTNFYSNFVTNLGATVAGVQTENTAQNASVTQLQTQNGALSSVNLNDEASVMATLERSYQAASQVFTMLNTVLQSALNLGQSTAVS